MRPSARGGGPKASHSDGLGRACTLAHARTRPPRWPQGPRAGRGLYCGTHARGPGAEAAKNIAGARRRRRQPPTSWPLLILSTADATSTTTLSATTRGCLGGPDHSSPIPRPHARTSPALTSGATAGLRLPSDPGAAPRRTPRFPAGAPEGRGRTSNPHFRVPNSPLISKEGRAGRPEGAREAGARAGDTHPHFEGRTSALGPPGPVRPEPVPSTRRTKSQWTPTPTGRRTHSRRRFRQPPPGGRPG